MNPRRGEPKLSIRGLAEVEERRAARDYREKMKAESSFGTLGDLLKAIRQFACFHRRSTDKHPAATKRPRGLKQAQACIDKARAIAHIPRRLSGPVISALRGIR